MNLRNAYLTAAALSAALAIAGCTDTERAHLTNYGQSARVTCQSAGAVYFDDETTGRVQHEEGGGYSFVSKSTGRLTGVSGTCVVDYGYVGDFKIVRPL